MLLRNLHLKSTEEAAFAADITVNGVRGVSADSLLEIPLHSVKGGCKKDIYRDVSGRIFYTWEDNLVKKGYYLNDNTDTEWKEIPTPEEPVEVPTIPDAVTTALSNCNEHYATTINFSIYIGTCYSRRVSFSCCK